MKFVPVLLSVCIGLGAFSFSSETKANDQLAVTLCEYIAVDDKGRVRKALKSSRVKVRNIFGSIQCNGNNILRHAIASNAVETGKLIVKGLPKSALSDGADIAWAESNGHGSSPLIAEIKKRAGL
ncbi:DUF3718 domain-containing protein [Pseudoalteromonas luteoviolacea]|uniref:DUF3718 domain-containing protein n=1 Tax=Pseudoalteromonas luteoviolacea H33 TaxID=1365251 RepID=A0A167FBY1_9GAMM|nr:DUF3718 domain-containing protein [Pseudoalteromonas luteoviolacea]KZN52038.1 hypothetical protein N476_01530 [Pseudoalteromonas luteoviolacea H33]KZN78754.1 hypothetical protein N477_08005 [Pseudoalteromonas luteoviolacea H33-S]MBQ4876118.1 DUF3718 domain-containing protein [Pseudoalteromonas luteoviolacea]MBQ4905753.1 DUF3718 domain-containing protein [Pseudoalteromonas luteoviolacea]